VSNNNFSSPLRETLCVNRKLIGIAAFNNSFSGNLPANLGNCILLEYLMLGDNRQLSGTLPADMSKLSHLNHLSLRGNRIYNWSNTVILDTKIDHTAAVNSFGSTLAELIQSTRS
jgi:hypothetical protein